MMTPLKVHQIHFDDMSRAACYQHNAVKLYDNSGNSPEPFFENQIIVDLVKAGEHKKSKYFGVWSWQHSRKIRNANIRLFSVDGLERKCKKGGFDVLSFFPHMKRQQIFHNATRLKYNAAFNRLMELMKYDFRADMNPRFIIMQNHFVGSTEMIDEYVHTCLIPAMKHMATDEKLIKALNIRTPYKAHSKVNYTFHTFVLERLVSTWLHINTEFNCKHWNDD